MCFSAYQHLSFWEFTYPPRGEASSTYPAYTPQRYQLTKFISCRNYMYNMLLLLSNGRSWIYSINLLASQYSFRNSLEVRSSFGHTRRWSLSIIVFFSLHIVQFLWLKILMWWRCAARQSWPVLSQKFATACYLGLFLLFSHVVLMFCHCVLLDEAMASWENFSRVFCFMSLLIVSKLSGVCLFVCFEVWFLFFLPVGRLFHCRVFLCVRGPTERQLSCPVCWGVLLFFLLLLLFICTICITWKYVTTRQVNVTTHTFLTSSLW